MRRVVSQLSGFFLAAAAVAFSESGYKVVSVNDGAKSLEP
jgi:hypothetical protein